MEAKLTAEQSELLAKYSNEVKEGKKHQESAKSEQQEKYLLMTELGNELKLARQQGDEEEVARIFALIDAMTAEYGKGCPGAIGESRTTLSSGSGKMGHNNPRD